MSNPQPTDPRETFERKIRDAVSAKDMDGYIISPQMYLLDPKHFDAIIAAADDYAAAKVREALVQLVQMGPDDMEVEAPGYEPPTDPMIVADQAFNAANCIWREAIAALPKEKP